MSSDFPFIENFIDAGALSSSARIFPLCPSYTIERWPLGWVLSPPAEHVSGIPLSALSELVSMLSGVKNAKQYVIDSGIVHHLRVFHRRRAIACVVTKEESDQWGREISESLRGYPRELQWWFGTDVGSSSATIFSVFYQGPEAKAAAEMARGSYPQDASDFGRCKRLFDISPQWRAKITRVSEAFPNSPWTALIAQWEKLENSPPAEQSKTISEITDVWRRGSKEKKVASA